MTMSRRQIIRGATALGAAGVLAAHELESPKRALAQPTPGATAAGIKALIYDVFGTCVDWRNGVARDAERILRPLGYELDWLAFADAWRALYQPTMEIVRSGREPFVKLDVLHRRMLDQIRPRFGLDELDPKVADDLKPGVAPARRLARRAARVQTAAHEIHPRALLQRQHRADGRHRAAQRVSVGHHPRSGDRARLQAQACRLSPERSRAEPAP